MLLSHSRSTQSNQEKKPKHRLLTSYLIYKPKEQIVNKQANDSNDDSNDASIAHNVIIYPK